MPASSTGKSNLPLAFGLALAAGVVIERGLKDFAGGFGGGGSSSGGSSAAGGAGILNPQGAVNPLPGWAVGRVDQGVDFSGGHLVLAPMAGKVLKIGAPGWPQGRPGSNGVLLQLVDGTVLYFYEGLQATVRAGQQVKAGQQIATGLSGQSIEVGFADKNGVPLSHAGYSEGKITNQGTRFLKWFKKVLADKKP